MASDSAASRASPFEFSLVARRESSVALVGCECTRASARSGIHRGNKLLGRGPDFHSHRVRRIRPHVGARIAVSRKSHSLLAAPFSPLALLSPHYFSRTPHVHESENWFDFDREKNGGRFEAPLRNSRPFAHRLYRP